MSLRGLLACQIVGERLMPGRRYRLSGRSTLVLTSLAGGSKHGYALIKDVEEFSGIALGPGTLYGALARLERDGLVEALAVDDRRHPYTITSAGRDALEAELAQSARIAKVGLRRIALGKP